MELADDDAVSRKVAEDRDAELLAWPGELIPNKEYVFGKTVFPPLQEQKRSFKVRTPLLIDGGSGKGCEMLWVGAAEGEVQKASRAMSRVGNTERGQSSVSLARAGGD